MDEATSDFISSIKFPLIVLVVLIHCLPNHYTPVPPDLSINSVYIFVSEFLSHVLGRIAVPLFFLISGYLFQYGHQDFTLLDYKKKLVKRIRTLLIPYLIWNTLFLLLIFIKNNVLHINDCFEWVITDFSVYTVYWERPLDYPLWYVRDLMCMVLVSPLLFIFNKYLHSGALILYAVFYLSCCESGITGLSTTAIAFFGCGMYFGQYKLSLPSKYSKIGILLLISALCLGIYIVLNITDIKFNFFIRAFVAIATVGCLFSAKSISNTVILKKAKRLAPYVLFILSSHTIYLINWTNSGLSSIFSFNPVICEIACYCLTPIILILALIALFNVLRHFCPKTLAVLNGGRLSY